MVVLFSGLLLAKERLMVIVNDVCHIVVPAEIV